MDIYLKKYFHWMLLIVCFTSNMSLSVFASSATTYLNTAVIMTMALLTVAYYWNNHHRLKREFPTLSIMYIYLLACTVIGLGKLFFIPSELFPYFIILNCTTIAFFGAVFYLSDPGMFTRYHKFLLKYMPWVFLLVALPFYESSVYMTILGMGFFYLYFFPQMSRRNKFVMLGAIVIFLLYRPQRFQEFRLVTSALLLILLAMHRWKQKQLWRGLVRIFNFIFMWVPVVLFTLAALGIFNIYQIGDSASQTYTSNGGENLLEDTRSGLFMEAFQSAFTHDYYLFGRSPVYGYDSIFQATIDNIDTQDFAQRNSEVQIINTFTWFGLCGVIMFFLLFYSASLKAIRHSRNDYMKIIGLNVSLIWLYGWIEVPLFGITLWNIVQWMLISMCFSKFFREMTNREFEAYMKNILK